MRILIAQMKHETNTFSSVRTDEATLNGATPMLRSRSTVVGASFVWSVDSTR